MLSHPEKASTITQAAYLLHNLITDKEKILIDIHNELETITAQVYPEDTTRFTNRRSIIEAIDIHEKFMKYFNSEIGSVPWQNKNTV